MTKVEIVGDRLSRTIEGVDVILSFKKQLEVPLRQVKSVELGITDAARARLEENGVSP
jgi:hypothetical protein